MASSQVNLAQSQYDRRTWWLIGLGIFVILCFCVTIPTLYVALVKSGFLGDRMPAGSGTVLLIGLMGLTAIYCLLMVHQQS